MKHLSVLILLLAIPATAATYYVSKQGNDVSGNGSMGAPWLTIGKAASVLQAGDSVLVRGGVYRETVKPVNHGTAAGGRVVYKAYPGEKVTISGTDSVTAVWTRCTAVSHPRFPEPTRVWYADVPSAWLRGVYEDSYIRMDQLLEDGERLTCAHWPDQTDPDNTYNLDEGYPLTGSTDALSMIDAVHLTQADDFWNGSVLKGMFGSGVNETHLYTVTDYDSASHALTVDKALRRTPQTAYDRYAIMNHPLGLDRPGEFYIDYDSSRVYLIPGNEDDPNGHQIEVSTRERGFDLGYFNASYLTIDGFEIKGFYGSGIHHYNLGEGDQAGLTIRNCVIRQNLMDGISLDVDVVMTATVIESNRVYNNDNKGFYFKCRSASFDSMDILYNIFDHNNNDDAVQVSGNSSNFLLKGNYIGPHRSIKGHTDGIKMASGTFTNWTFDGNILVDNLMDWGTTSFKNLVFINNVFTKGKHFHVRYRTVNGFIFINNTIYEPTTVAMYLGTAVTGVVIKNNIFDLRYQRIDWGGAQMEKDHNFYMGTLPGDAGTGSLAGDSLVLADPVNGNYRPVAGSALIDAGTDVSVYGVTADLAGNTRPLGVGWDIGAYEWIPNAISDTRPEIITAGWPIANPLKLDQARQLVNGGLIRLFDLQGNDLTQRMDVRSGFRLIRCKGQEDYQKVIIIR